ncbi:AAA+ family ATPase [Halodurantibacterium flavum]|uniref:AAA+ family ATPase n=1 Tax=Halodurantibacterium flavum TaxID=1382802 RepID=A0ABW4S287_9RHOB
MRHAIALSLMLATAAPAAAQDDWSEGLDRFQEGAQRLLQEFLREVEPGLRDLTRDLARQIDDLTLYHRPEVLPNGDILIRRRAPRDAPPTPDRAPQDRLPPGLDRDDGIEI